MTDALPTVESFSINPVGGTKITVEDGDRFCHERDVKAFKDAAAATITTLQAQLSAAVAREAVLVEACITKREIGQRCKLCGESAQWAYALEHNETCPLYDLAIPATALLEEVKGLRGERVAVWMGKNGYATGHGDTVDDLLIELDWQHKDRATLAEQKLADRSTLK